MSGKTRTIFDAVRDGTVTELEGFIRQGVSINATEEDKNKFTPLQLAANEGQLECLQWLLWYGADNAVPNPRGWTAAHLASIRGHDACLQALINNGAGLTLRDLRGCSPVHLAATHGHAFTLSTILRTGADANAEDKNGWTPVHYATYHGRLGCLQLLVRWGGRVVEVDIAGNSAFHLAATEGQLSCLKFLVCSTATPSISEALAARNDHGETPKMLAQQFYKEYIVAYISGLEWEKTNPMEGPDSLAFPAHVAAYAGDLNHVRALVEQGVVNINERNARGNTPLHRSAGQGHVHCVQWLIESGADSTLTNDSGETSLDLARRFAHLGCVELISTSLGITDEEEPEPEVRAWARSHGHAPSATIATDAHSTSLHMRREAKARALNKLKETTKVLEVSKKNYEQLGGNLSDMGIINQEQKVPTPEDIDAAKAEKMVAELQAALEYERLRREKLEAQLDECRGGIEKLNASNSSRTLDEDGISSASSDVTDTLTGRSTVRSSSRRAPSGKVRSPRTKPISGKKVKSLPQRL